IADAEYLLVFDIVIGRVAAECRSGDFLDLVDGIGGRDEIGSLVRERRVAAGLVRAPRQVGGGGAAVDDAVVPVALQHFRGAAGRRCVGIRAEISNAAVQVDLAVRRDAHEPVETVGPGGMIALPDADTDYLVALSPRLVALLLP